MIRFILFIVFGCLMESHSYAQPYMLKNGQTATQIKDGKISFNDGSQQVKTKSKNTSNQRNGRAVKHKKYPSRSELETKGELYPEFGSRTVATGPICRYYLYENGTRIYYIGGEILYSDGTLRKWNGSMVLADGSVEEYKGEIIRLDGTIVDEYGIPIKGAKKITPIVYGEGNKKPEEVLGIPKNKTK